MAEVKKVTHLPAGPAPEQKAETKAARAPFKAFGNKFNQENVSTGTAARTPEIDRSITNIPKKNATRFFGQQLSRFKGASTPQERESAKRSWETAERRYGTPSESIRPCAGENCSNTVSFNEPKADVTCPSCTAKEMSKMSIHQVAFSQQKFKSKRPSKHFNPKEKD